MNLMNIQSKNVQKNWWFKFGEIFNILRINTYIEFRYDKIACNLVLLWKKLYAIIMYCISYKWNTCWDHLSCVCHDALICTWIVWVVFVKRKMDTFGNGGLFQKKLRQLFHKNKVKKNTVYKCLINYITLN